MTDTLHYTYRAGKVCIEGDTVITTLPDGAVVVAKPNYTKEDADRARRMGYRGEGVTRVIDMTRDHDWLHTLLADALGFDESYALRAAVTGEENDLSDAEEDVVLAMQRLLNLHREEQNKPK